MSFTSHDIFDYAFIGLGCGNALVVLQLEEHGLLEGKRILVIEPANKRQNDRTFCFWMEPQKVHNSFLSRLIEHEWKHVNVGNSIQSLETLSYFRISGLTLNESVIKLLEREQALHIEERFEGCVSMMEESTQLLLNGRTFRSLKVFDNRPPEYSPPHRSEARLWQSFYGWEIQTEGSAFDPSCFTMMDFNVEQEGATQFMYVLPFNERRALVEITRFGELPITEGQAERALHRYLEERSLNFTILEREQGRIPMFIGAIDVKESSRHCMNTGERAGRLKPSTGYSFDRSLKHAECLVEALLHQNTAAPIKIGRFEYYDRLLLQILRDMPEKGSAVFQQLFQRNPMARVLRFLDERTGLTDELRVLLSLPLGLFLKAAFLDFRWRFCLNLKKVPWVLWLALWSLLMVTLGQREVLYGTLGVGMLAVGIPHGALDHLVVLNQPSGRKIVGYMAGYIAMGALVFGLFFLLPWLGLLFFLTFSAWHFGMTDFAFWDRTKLRWGFLWGAYYLGALLFSHGAEVSQVLAEMNIQFLSLWTVPGNLCNLWIGLGGLVFLLIKPKIEVLGSVIALLVLAYIPLIPAFGVFFIFQHSLHGWQQLKDELGLTHQNLWLKAWPFTVGSLLMLLAVLTVVPVTWGQVFIFLAALSFPHVYFASRFLKKQRKG
jgi:lycopene beta-cyclase